MNPTNLVLHKHLRMISFFIGAFLEELGESRFSDVISRKVVTL